MTSAHFYGALGVFVGSAIVVLVAACVAAKRADERMQQWMAEREAKLDPLELQYSLPAREPRRTARG